MPIPDYVINVFKRNAILNLSDSSSYHFGPSPSTEGSLSDSAQQVNCFHALGSSNYVFLSLSEVWWDTEGCAVCDCVKCNAMFLYSSSTNQKIGDLYGFHCTYHVTHVNSILRGKDSYLHGHRFCGETWPLCSVVSSTHTQLTAAVTYAWVYSINKTRAAQ